MDVERTPDRLYQTIDGMPRLIQAGMGARISSWQLANTAARLGAVGVVSSVGLRLIVLEEVREGNEETIAIARTFPVQRYVDDLLAFAPGGPMHRRPHPMDSPDPRKSELPRRLSALGAYVEVMRAKQGHQGKVGINVMWKVALSALPSIYGAMLAGVDVLLCGAGVPMELPDIVRRIRAGEDLEYLPLTGTDTNVRMSIAADGTAAHVGRLEPPKLIPILSNFAFPKRILDVWERQYGGVKPFAFVLENHRAGGHNAPPRNKSEFAEPDELDSYFEKSLALGIPIYVAGAGASRGEFESWLDRGAYGMQVGSRFALCSDSGLRPDLREDVIRRNAEGTGRVLTSYRYSSTGYPFKYVDLPGTLSDDAVYQARKRICNLGYLLQSHMRERADGSSDETYICAGMPEQQYVKLGGDAEETVGRMCLCNALLSTCGLAKDGQPPLVTLGENGLEVKERLTARQVLEDILGCDYVATMEDRLSG